MYWNLNTYFDIYFQMPPGQHQYGGQYPPAMLSQRHSMPMVGGSCPGPGPMKPSMPSMFNRRQAPYPNPYAQKRQPMYPNGAQMDVSISVCDPVFIIIIDP